MVPFNIEADTLGRALLEFGAQAHVQISFAPDSATARLQPQKLKGNYTGKEALERLLKGSGLKFVTQKETIEILPDVSPSASDGPHLPRSTRPSVHLGSILSSAHDPESMVNDPPAQMRKGKRPLLQEVVVTGSRLSTTDKEGPQEVQIYGSAQIDQSGQNSVSDFLTTLPSVSLSSQSTAMGVGTTVTLRGLPAGTTLVLLNGRSIESSGLAYWASGASYFDLNSIPLSAVDRIEVVENGSSAVYGSDAIAGVVNVILKNDFDGIEANAKYDWAKGLGTARTDLAWGKQWQTGGLSVIGSYDVDGGLLNSERSLSATNDYTAYGGPYNNYPVCSQGNVFSSTGAPLPGAPGAGTATVAAVTGSASSGTPPLSQFTYATLNNCSLIAGASLLPSTHRLGLIAQGHVEITPTIELFSEVMYTKLSQTQWLGYQMLFGIPEFQEYTVSNTNPFNPFGTTVGIAESLHDVPEANLVNTDFFRPLIGLRGAIAYRWKWEVAAWQSTDWTRNVIANDIPNATGIQDALNSAEPAAALNPFVTGPVASQAVLNSLFANGDIKWMSRDRSAEASIQGPIVKVPAGTLQAVLGGSYVRSAFDTDDINDGVDPLNTRLNYARTNYAVFGEARVPLIARRNHGGQFGSLLAVTISGRRDRYSDFGGTTTQQYGAELRPTGSFLVRGTFGTAFEAPPLPSLYNPQTTSQTEITDPLTGEPEVVQLLSGGNPHLQPMTGRTHTVGAVYSSQIFPGLVVSATQWQVVEKNAIQVISPQTIVDSESSFPTRVDRDSVGSIDEVIATAINFGSIDAAGIDYQLAYRLPLLGSLLAVDLNATETYHYRQALQPGVPAIEAAGNAEDDQDWSPKWKGTVGVGWKLKVLTIHLDGRYTGSYQDYDSTTRIGKFWLFDSNIRWDFGEQLAEAGQGLRGAYVEGGATNLFNRAPQFSNYGSDFFGYDLAEMSIVGRSLYVATGVRW